VIRAAPTSRRAASTRPQTTTTTTAAPPPVGSAAARPPPATRARDAPRNETKNRTIKRKRNQKRNRTRNAPKQVEQLSLETICARAGLKCDFGKLARASETSTKTNHHDAKEGLDGATWDDLCEATPFMCARAKGLGALYGYAAYQAQT
jgi:hypothetical protein